jgi:hypothetical protein
VFVVADPKSNEKKVVIIATTVSAAILIVTIIVALLLVDRSKKQMLNDIMKSESYNLPITILTYLTIISNVIVQVFSSALKGCKSRENCQFCLQRVEELSMK